jgi:hypothetical protein
MPIDGHTNKDINIKIFTANRFRAGLRRGTQK